MCRRATAIDLSWSRRRLRAHTAACSHRVERDRNLPPASRENQRPSASESKETKEGKVASGVGEQSGLRSSFVRRWLRFVTYVWERAKSERSSPREIGWSVAVGAFSGCTPFLGLHLWIALALATLLRLSRLWAVVGSRISFAPLFAGIAFCEIQSAHRLRTGAWVTLSPHDAVAHGRELLADWLLGAVVLGSALAAAVGFVVYLSARRWQSPSPLPKSAAASRDSTRNMPSALRRPSSESRRSTPPAPTH
jgi:uncharacterized protein (DUF2062 family)